MNIEARVHKKSKSHLVVDGFLLVSQLEGEEADEDRCKDLHLTVGELLPQAYPRTRLRPNDAEVTKYRPHRRR